MEITVNVNALARESVALAIREQVAALPKLEEARPVKQEVERLVIPDVKPVAQATAPPAPQPNVETFAVEVEALLQEAVFRSRGKQAALAGLAGLAPDAKLAAGQRGLGPEAAVELDLSPKGIELANRLWSEPLATAELERVRDVLRNWVRAQDGLDRDRNHFLKGFRREHGFDRRQYTDEQLGAYEAGLAQVNGRGTLTFHEINEFDLEYVETRSLMVDLRIMFRTVLTVLKGAGAA